LNEGFLGTAAPRLADLVLLLEIGMGLALLGGAVLARRKRFRLHAFCQSAVVLLNFAIILLVMVPSFLVHVSPKVPARLGKAYYSLATAHAALGAVTEIAALYILLSAGTDILPQQLRLTNYRLWMRSVLALWWLVLLLGVATYIRWYVPDLIRARENAIHWISPRCEHRFRSLSNRSDHSYAEQIRARSGRVRCLREANLNVWQDFKGRAQIGPVKPKITSQTI